MNPLLQALVESKPGEAVAGDSPLASPRPAPLKKLRYTHEALIDSLLTNPWMSQDDRAELFNLSPSWLSTVICSDLFQSRLAERREQMVDPEVRLSLKTQMEGVLHRSMEILRHKLDQKPGEIPDQFAVQVAKMASQSLGMGVKESRVTVQETHVHLEQLGENLVGLLRRRKAEIIDGQVTEDPHGQNPQLQQGAGAEASALPSK